MVFRGVVKNGVVEFENGARLFEGVVVRIEPATRRTRSRRNSASKTQRAPRKRMTAAQRVAALHATFGMWKNRPEWKGKSTLQIQAELRRRAMGRG